MMGDSESGSFTWDEIVAKFPAVIDLVNSIAAAVKQAQTDGKLSGTEIGDLLAMAGPKLGRLVDEVIADLQD